MTVTRRPAARMLTFRPRAPQVVGLVLWLVLQMVVFLNSAGDVVVDIKPEVYVAPWRSFWSYLSTWQADPQLGFPSFNVGLAPVAGVVGLLHSLGAGPEVSFRILHGVLLTAAALGAARLFAHLSPRPGDAWGPLVAAVVYVANPYTVVAGATLGILWPYAVLPWFMWALVRAVETGGGWRWPAAVGLLFMATTGMNAGVIAVMQLVSAPFLVLLARSRAGRSWAEVARVLARCVGMATLLSVYWLVPTVAALGAGGVVVSNSETLSGIASTSSWAEVLRGLGIWPLYGRDSSGPWVPEHVGYLVSAPQLVASYAFTAVVGLSVVVARGRLRIIALCALVATGLVMVGLFPPGQPTLFGRALRWALNDVPGLAAFRTTNKAGASLVLAASLLVGAAAVAWLGGQHSPRRRVGAGLVLLVALLGSAVPALNGNLYISPFEVPGYWRAAAASLDEGASDQRVWLVPGEVSANYRWTRERPDDLTNSLLRRPALVRTVIPVTAPAAANLLAAADIQLQEGSMPPAGLSTYARYLGVGDVVLRNDIVWEKTAGARPAALQAVVNGDPGLRPVRNFGRPGENTRSSTVPPADAFEAALPPVQHYEVVGADDPVRTESLPGTVLLAGDGYGVTQAQQGGLLPAGAGFRYLADLPDDELRPLLGAQNRIVLTDTNRRRTTVAGRLVDGQGPLLRPAEDPGATRALGTSADQTVLLSIGGRATASAVGSAFGTFPQAAPENAVDGRLDTSWRFGDFRNAPGEHLDVRLKHEVRWDRVVVHTADLGAVRISRVRVSAGPDGASDDVRVGSDGTATAHLGGVLGSRLRVTVLGIQGAGFNQVGIAEVTAPGLRVQRAARLPVTLQRRASQMDADLSRRLALTPLDVALSRVSGVPADPTDDEETGLERGFSLPGSRTFRPYGVAQATADLPEGELDTLAGADGVVLATSSSRAFDLPTVRASAALDGDPATAWVPGRDVVGETLTVSAPSRRLDHVDLRQPRATTPDLGWASVVRVALDGHVVGDFPAHPGRTRLTFPPRLATSLTLTILARKGPGAVRIAEVGFGGARVTHDPELAARACIAVATADGNPLLVRLTQPITGVDPTLFGPCGGRRLRLDAGAHRLSEKGGWVLDQLVLRDVIGELPVAPSPGPHLTVTSSRPTSFDLQVGAARAPYTLVLGQAFDPRWRASIDGRDLGAPSVVDGYSAGWQVRDPGPHRISIRYGPQRPADAAIGVSVATVGGAAALVILGGRDRGALAPAPEPAPAPRGTQPVGALPDRLRSRDTRRAAVVGWFLTAVLVFVVGGVWLGVLGLVLGAVDLVRRLAASALLRAGLACWAALPVIWIAGNSDRWHQVTPQLVTGNPWSNSVAAAGLLLLVTGAVRQELEDPSGRLARRD